MSNFFRVFLMAFTLVLVSESKAVLLELGYSPVQGRVNHSSMPSTDSYYSVKVGRELYYQNLQIAIGYQELSFELSDLSLGACGGGATVGCVTSKDAEFLFKALNLSIQFEAIYESYVFFRFGGGLSIYHEVREAAFSSAGGLRLSPDRFESGSFLPSLEMSMGLLFLDEKLRIGVNLQVFPVESKLLAESSQFEGENFSVLKSPSISLGFQF